MPSRLEEATEVSKTYQLALAKIGVQTVAEALAVWRSNTPEDRNSIARWLATATALVLRRRAQADALAVAYYRLARALLTGSTVTKPNEKAPPARVTIGELRREFRELAGETEITTVPAEQGEPTRAELEPASEQSATPVSEQQAEDRPSGDVDLGEEASDGEAVGVETLSEERADRVADESPQDPTNLAVVREEVASALQTLGPRNLARKNQSLDRSRPASEVDAERKANAAQAGARQAASASRIAMNGARKRVWDMHERDSKALGYIRISTTGTPCGFCAMLISRGPVYKTAASAGFGEGNLFHDNCYCIAVPVFSDEQYNEDPMFAQNRLYSDQWGDVTRGLSGKAALSAWRRFIRQEQLRKSPSAQAA